MAEPLKIVVLEGDETGQELLEASLRVLEADIGVDISLERHDLSLERRRSTENRCVTEAAEGMRRARYGLKAATITPEGADDVGSPNRLLREAVDGEGDRAHGAADPGGGRAAGGRAPPDLGRADGGRGRLRGRAVAGR